MALRAALDARGWSALSKVGTVDKMQGQGAPVLIYSLAASNPDFISAQNDWIFSTNRWNVALSRAKALTLIIGDIEAHRNASPTNLNGIQAQNKIMAMLDDPAWSKE